MNPFICSVLLLFVSGFCANAQTEKIDGICLKYDSLLGSAIQEGNPNLIPSITVKSTLNKRAIGVVKHDITIYFDEFEIRDDESDFPPEKRAIIRKLVFNINAGSYAIRYQYYFDKNGALIKYKEVEVGYECIIRNLYFKKDQLIRHRLKPTKKGCLPEDKVKGFDRSEMTEKDKLLATQIKKEAQKFKELLRLNYALIAD